MSVLTAKRRLKVLQRVPKHEQDDVWSTEVASLQSGIEEAVRKITEQAPRQGEARVQEEQARAASIQPATAAPSQPRDAAAEEAKPAPTTKAPVAPSSQPLLSQLLSLYRDVNSRTEYGFSPLVLSALLPLFFPQHTFAILSAMHAILVLRYVISTTVCTSSLPPTHLPTSCGSGFQSHTHAQTQNPLYSLIVYTVRDFLPSAATAVATLAILPDLTSLAKLKWQ